MPGAFPGCRRPVGTLVLAGPCLEGPVKPWPHSLSLLFCFALCDPKVAHSDAMCPELAWSSSIEVKEAQARLRSPPRSVSPHQHMSPTRTSSPTSLHPALQAVQTAIERRLQQEQVGDHSSQGQHSHKSCTARVASFMEFSTACPGGTGSQVSMGPALEPHSLGRGLRCLGPF